MAFDENYAHALDIKFVEKFIAYIDVLGFKNLVSAAEVNGDGLLLEVIATLRASGADARSEYEQYGPIICPESKYIQRNLDFRASHVSDCVILSSEVSAAGVINLLSQCFQLILRLLRKGVMCRGYVTRGNISHSDTQFYGTGYQKAYASESDVAVFKRSADERGTPFVEIDSGIAEYVGQSDKCVQQIFERLVKRDGDLLALFPFQTLQHEFVIGDFWGHKFDPESERQSNRNVRKWLNEMKERVTALGDKTNPSAVSKAEHYLNALDAQLAICNSTEVFLRGMKRP